MYHDVIREVCAKYGKVYTKELQSRMTGGTDRAISEYVVKELKINDSVDKFEQFLLQVTAERLPHAPLQKGVERLLKHLLLHQVPMALATNSTAHQVKLHSKMKPEIFKVFHHAVTATDPDVGRAKPFPDLFLLAASKFAEKPAPAKCLVFEDSIVGLRAGVAAGMQVVLTPHTSQYNPEDAKVAAVVLDSLSEFKPELFGLPPFEDTPRTTPLNMSFITYCSSNGPIDHGSICKGISEGKPNLPKDPVNCESVCKDTPKHEPATFKCPPPPCPTPCYPPRPSACPPRNLEPSSNYCKPKKGGRPPWHSMVMFMLLCGITYATLDRLW